MLYVTMCFMYIKFDKCMLKYGRWLSVISNKHFYEEKTAGCELDSRLQLLRTK